MNGALTHFRSNSTVSHPSRGINHSDVLSREVLLGPIIMDSGVCIQCQTVIALSVEFRLMQRLSPN